MNLYGYKIMTIKFKIYFMLHFQFVKSNYFALINVRVCVPVSDVTFIK